MKFSSFGDGTSSRIQRLSLKYLFVDLLSYSWPERIHDRKKTECFNAEGSSASSDRHRECFRPPFRVYTHH